MLNHLYLSLNFSEVASVCTFVGADGRGGTETYVTTTDTAQECAQYVMTNEPTANGATWGVGGGRCYAEYGQTGISVSSSWQNCYLTMDNQG